MRGGKDGIPTEGIELCEDAKLKLMVDFAEMG